MPDDRIIGLKNEIEDLKKRLNEREDALPAHSVRPHQLQAVLELEENILEKEKELQKCLKCYNEKK